ncbi:TetR family transcriptional regulator [Allorhizocola rhizosphaerae]|uniref:acyl-CoA-like ligand-binding transcription factor n=1 Tax=Allorhizocola rhizosphaerae TaxID=1872709 RepID=UPI0013C33AD9|nr:TetR family transcriptional regulator [Allorhizocola rhizosphaerae]
MPGHVLNRRETHKQQTRAALEDAALALFGRKGYEETTVEEIAAEAGVSVRTFFRYFASKRHVLFGDVAYHRISLLGERLAKRPPEEDPLDSVRAVLEELDFTDPAELAQIRTRMALMQEQPSLIGTYLLINHELQRLVAAFVGERSGLTPTHPYPMTVASAASSAWDVALWAWAGGSGDLVEVRRRTFDQLTLGVTKP